MKSLKNLAIVATLLTALPAWACTPEEATAKREQLAQEVAKLTEQNPTKAKEMNDELQKMDLDTESAQVPLACVHLHHHFAGDELRQFLTQYLRRHRVVPHLPQCELSTKKILLHPCHLE